MKIIMNGATWQSDAATLADLLVECGFADKVATALNGKFVPAAQRGTTQISEGDQIEVVAPMQGG